jgi:L-iditol 2-dehydrogenase
VKALVYTQPYRLEVRDLPDPVLRSNEALVQTRAVGVCGSDLHGFSGRSKRRVPPLVLGHEFSGEIAATGSDISRFKAGDKVIVYPLVFCGLCEYCLRNWQQLCVSRKLFGLDFHGAMAEYVAVPEDCIIPLPSGLSYSAGALVEPLAVGLHVLEQCSNVAGKTGLIYGAGGIGLLTYLSARQMGASSLAVVDRNPHRLEKIKELGADLTVNANEQDPVEMVLAWTRGRGVDFAVDAVGVRASQLNTIACTASGGTVVVVGLVDSTCEIDFQRIILRELRIRGSYAYTKPEFQQALSWIAQGVIPAEKFVSEASLWDGQKVFEELTTGSSKLTKVILTI